MQERALLPRPRRPDQDDGLPSSTTPGSGSRIPDVTPTAVRVRPPGGFRHAPLSGSLGAALIGFGVAGAVISALLHLPVWTTEPVFSSINTAVVATMLALGAYLVMREGERFTGYAFAFVGLSWLTYVFDVYDGWGSYLTWTLAGLPYAAMAWGILRYRRKQLETIHEKLLVPVCLIVTSGFSAATAPFLPPEMLGFRADAAWPPVTALAPAVTAAVIAVLMISIVALAGYFCWILRRCLRRAPRISRPSLRPMALFGGALAVCAAGVQSAAVALPELLTPHLGVSMVGILFLGVMGGLIASLTMEELHGSRLLARLPLIRTPQTISAYVSDILEDPSAELLFWSDRNNTLIDVNGHRRVLDPAGPDERFTEWILDGEGNEVALLTGDAAALADPAALESLARILTIVSENAQLNALLRMRVVELTATRTAEKLAFARAQEEFHRNLHDGLQQTIATARMDLDGLHDVVDTDAAHCLIDELSSKLSLGLDQVRSLKKGSRPPELRFGLKTAVERTLAELHLPATTAITDIDLGILTLPVYYLAREALTNIHKHAHATSVEITIGTDGGRIDILVRDDGVGGARVTDAGGIDGMCRRAAELGGVLHIASPTGKGTTLRASIPCVSS